MSGHRTRTVQSQEPQRVSMRPGARALPPLVRELIGVVQTLSVATELETVQAVVLHAVRRITGADGVTFVVRDGDRCYYLDEDAIGPLWKGQRFPSSSCISGWVMEHGQPAVVPDILHDDRIPQSVYEPTFVRALAMVPIRALDPLGAIGVYWAEPQTTSAADVEAVQAIADATAVTLERLRSDRALASRMAELEEANDALAEANQRLEHVAAIIAHDLRSPLATVEGLLTTLQARAGDGLDATATELTVHAVTQVRGLRDAVEALLSLSQVQRDPLVIEDVEVRALVETVAGSLATEIEDAEAEVEVESDGTLRGDPTLLRILLQNLISNAVRYRHPARPQVIRVGVQHRGQERVLTVTDRGVGLEPSEVAGLFELAGDRRHRRGTGHGTGFGLVTCRRIAERHGGTITAEPRTVGARFVVRLPTPPSA